MSVVNTTRKGGEQKMGITVGYGGHDRSDFAAIGPDLRMSYSPSSLSMQNGYIEILGKTSYRDYFMNEGAHHSLIQNMLGVRLNPKLGSSISPSFVVMAGVTYTPSKDRLRSTAFIEEMGPELKLPVSEHFSIDFGVYALWGQLSFPQDNVLGMSSLGGLTYGF